jgi:lipopolysaccharide export system ATP-binding protein
MQKLAVELRASPNRRKGIAETHERNRLASNEPCRCAAATFRGLSVVSIAKSYDKKAVLTDVSLGRRSRRGARPARPERRRQDHLLLFDHGLVKPDSGRILLDGEDITGLPMYRRAISASAICRRRPRSSAASPSRRTSWRCSRVAEPDKASARSGSSNCSANSTSSGCATPGHGAVGRRAAALRDRPRARRQSIDHAARRAVRGIDPISIQDIRDLIVELKKRNIGVLITDHNVRETLDIVDRACIIYGGQVLFAGSPRRSSPTRTSAASISARVSSCRMSSHGQLPTGPS